MHENHDPGLQDSLGGPADEFAMFHPMGFDEARAGESFVKIGVGLLAKGESDEYRFHGDYKMLRAGTWEIENGADWIEFSQQMEAERGWAYRYRITIRLAAAKAEFTIEYRLENSGSKLIDINHYNHNFTLIDGMPFGPEYEVELAFSAAEPVAINGLAWFRDDRIEVESALADESLCIQLYEGEARSDYNRAVVRHKPSGASVEFSGDAAIDRMVF